MGRKLQGNCLRLFTYASIALAERWASLATLLRFLHWSLNLTRQLGILRAKSEGLVPQIGAQERFRILHRESQCWFLTQFILKIYFHRKWLLLTVTHFLCSSVTRDRPRPLGSCNHNRNCHSRSHGNSHSRSRALRR